MKTAKYVGVKPLNCFIYIICAFVIGIEFGWHGRNFVSEIEAKELIQQVCADPELAHLSDQCG